MKTRRGFTMLEILLAAVIGSLIIVACLAVFTAMDGMDRALNRRIDETAEMAKLHLVMQRTFSSLVMSDQPAPRIRRPGEETGTAASTSTTAATRSATGASGSGGATSDTGSSSGTAVRSSKPSTDKTSSSSSSSTSSPSGNGTTPSATSASTTASGDTTSADEKLPPGRFIIAPNSTVASTVVSPTSPALPQRLEVVLKKAPIADPRAALLPPATVTTTTRTEVTLPASSTDSSAASSKSKSATGDSTGAKSQTTSATDTDQKQADAARRTTTIETTTTGEAEGVRGFFEMVRESSLPDYRPSVNRSSTLGESWALMWTPVPPASTTLLTQPAVAPQPLVVARGLAACRWRAFADRERKDQFSAVWSSDLPAYVEMDVQTVSGLRASWLFEVEWSQGPEPGEPAAVAAGGGGGGGPGGGGPGGGARFRGRDGDQGGGRGQGITPDNVQRIPRGTAPDGQGANPFRERRRREMQEQTGPQQIRRDGQDSSSTTPPAGQPPRRQPRRPRPQQ